MATIDNNIIQSLGVGSGIDTQNLVKQLVAVEKADPQNRIDTKRTLAQTQISDLGTLKSALATLQDAAKVLTDPASLYSKSASYTDSKSLVPAKLDTDAQTGSYSFTVDQLAASHTISFSGFSSATDAVGEGTLTINFGAWSRDANGDINGAFSADPDHASATITIDSSNNTLQGLRDAINKANVGVKASIINDGSSYHLSVVAASGANNELEIVASEAGGTPTNTDNSDLSRFAFNDQKSGFESADAQGGQDAKLELNGVVIQRSTNTIDDIVQGLTFDVLKPTDVGESVTITVTDDKAFAEKNIRAFVDAYNAFIDATKPLFGVTETKDDKGVTTKVVGSLSKDGLSKSMLTQIRSVIASAIPGLADSDLTSLTNVGIRTEIADGKLSINDTDFQKALDNNFEDVQKLFAPHNSSDSDSVTINSTNGNTQTGDYNVVITQAPARGYYNGGAFSGISFPLDTTGKTYDFQVEVNGLSSGTLTIPTDTYTDEASLASTIQGLINNDSTISAGGASVTVSYNSGTGGFDITSNQYGDSSIVSVLAASADTSTDLGLTVADGTAGKTVAGTIDGVDGFGSANVLLPGIKEPGSGMAMLIGENATSATVHFSRGFGGALDALLSNFLSKSGAITTRTSTLDDNLKSLDEDQKTLDTRMDAYQQRLQSQFTAMEQILSSLNTSGTFLDNLINTLPYTSGSSSKN